MKLKNVICAGVLSTMALSSALGLTACNKNKEEVKDQYNFYMTVSTNPTTYATLDMYSKSNAKNYINFARKGTITQESLPNGSYIVETDDAANNELKMDVAKMGKKIKDAYRANKKAQFNFYVDDLNTQYFFDAVVANNIPYSQVTLNLISDGAGTYSNLANEIAALSDKTDAGIKTYYETCVLSYNKLFEAYEEGETFIGYTNGDRAQAQTYTFGGVEYKGIYKSTIMNMAIANVDKGFKVNYFVQANDIFNKRYPESTYPEFTKIINNVGFKKFELSSMYKALKPEQQTAMLNGALSAAFIADKRLGCYIDPVTNERVVDGTASSATYTNKNTMPWTKTELDQMFAVPTGKKGVLVIMGTNGGEVDSGATTAEEAKATPYGQTLTKIYEMYGADYKIINKPHPSKNYAEGTKALFEEYGITVMPGRFASQYILWCYGDKIIAGGYKGSTWYDAGGVDVKFMVDTEDDITQSVLGYDVPSLDAVYAQWQASQNA